jgi:ribonuclease HIII
MCMTNIFVTTLSAKLIEPLRAGLHAQGFEFSQPQYTYFLAKKKGISITLYESLKLTVQGKEMKEFIEYYLEPEILKSFTFSHPASSQEMIDRIGSDEAGKGDFFGPLAVASFFAEGKQVELLLKMGIKDSKTLSDQKVLALAKELRCNFDHEIITISPAKYNELYAKFLNVNTLLAWAHATAIEKLHSRHTACQRVIVDKFANEYVLENALKKKHLSLQVIQKVRAEEDIVVAAASILARAQFLEGLERASSLAGIKLPKGASQAVIVAGRSVVNKQGKAFLSQVAKTHFRTTEQVI